MHRSEQKKELNIFYPKISLHVNLFLVLLVTILAIKGKELNLLELINN